MEGIPINGRNYTDLMALQPGVTPFPHRDNGSVVAHGLAMSVNGQDPRANVYLLDGTLLNDFTNGPAGSAAGTALGMDTVREFRVEANAYSAEFGRNIGGQINAITKSGTNRFTGSAFEFHRNDALDARNYFDVGDQAGLHAQSVRRHGRRPDSSRPAVLLCGLRSAAREPRPDHPDPRPGRQRAAGHAAVGPVTIDPAIQPFLDEFPPANGANLGDGLARYTFPFDQRLTSTSARARIDAVIGERRAGVRPLHHRRRRSASADGLPTVPAFLPLAQPVRDRRVPSCPRGPADRAVRLQPDAHRPERRSEHAQPLPVFVPGRSIDGLDRYRRLPALRHPGLGEPAAAAGRLQPASTTSPQSRGPHLLKAGALAEHYRDDELNPTFSLGIFRFASLSTFLRNVPLQFIGLTPAGRFRPPLELDAVRRLRAGRVQPRAM